MVNKENYFLAHGIRISEILPWGRKSYLTHAILQRLSREGYILWLFWNSRILSPSDVIVMLKRRHHMKLYLSVFTDNYPCFISLLYLDLFVSGDDALIS